MRKVILVALALFLLWNLKDYFFPDDEQLIKDTIDQFIEYVEVDGRAGEEHPVVSLDKGQEASQLFLEPISVLVRRGEREKKYSFSQNDLAQKLVMLRRYVASLQLSYSDTRMSIDGERASVVLKGQAIWRFQGDEQLYREIKEGKINFQKQQGTWFMTYAENIEPFEWDE